MKKIFAFILASIMVLSLVPASAFAAVTNCPKTHTVAVCDSLGISYSQIGDPIAADCKSGGYTLYECDDCGEQFVGNFTEKAEHAWKSNTKLAHLDVKADCVKGVTGITHEVCSVCNTTRVKETLPNHKDAHKLTKVAGSGVGCAARYTCSVCGGEWYMDKDGYLVEAAAHDWVFDSVKTEPTIVDGIRVNGLATYKCSICKDSKDVEILSECQHYNVASNPVVEYSAPACDVAGTEAVYQCPDCFVYFVVVSDGFELLADNNNDDVIDLADATIAAPGHVYDEEEGVKDGCVITYFCEECELSFTKDDHANWVAYGDPVGLASCISKCYESRFCLDCGEVYVVETGATDPDHKTVSYTKDSNCNEVGYKGKYCLECDEYTYAEITEKDSSGNYKLAEGVDYVVVVEDPDGINVTHYYRVVYRTVIAKNPNNHRLGVKGSDGSFTDKADLVQPSCTENTTLRILECLYCDDFGYELWSQTKASHAKTIKLGTIAHNRDAADKFIIPEYFVEVNGAIVRIPETELAFANKKAATIYYCEKCDQVWKEDGSQSTIKSATFYPNLAKVYKEYGYFEMSILPIAYEGFEILEGKYVDVRELYNEDTPTVKITAIKEATSCAAKGYVSFKAYEEKTNYTGTTRYAYTTSSIHTLAENAKWYPGKAPNCEEAGSWGYYLCSKCGAKFHYEGGENNFNTQGFELYGMNPIDATQTVRSTYDLNKHVTTIDIVEPVQICYITSYWKCYNDGCGATFLDEEASIPFDPEADVHVWVYAKGYDGKAATCNEDGTIQIRTCANCKTIEFNALFETSGEIIVDNLYTGVLSSSNNSFDLADNCEYKTVLKFSVTVDGKTATDLSASKTSAIIPMYNHKAPFDGFTYKTIDDATKTYVDVECAKGEELRFQDDEASDPAILDHSKAQFIKHTCAACAGELLTNYVPATGGHINAAGEILTTACDNEVIEDRICVLCVAAGVANAEIAVPHVPSEELVVPATCVSVGYTYWYCLTEGCGVRVVKGNEDDEFVTDPEAHDFVATVDLEANYAHDGQTFEVCALCGEAGEPTSEPAPKVAGVEISLYTEFDSYMPGSIVNVTVSLESLLGVDVWAARFPVIYDPAVYEYVGILEGSVAAEFSSAYAILTANSISETEVELIPGSTDMYCATGNVGAAGVLSVVAQAEENINVKGSYDLVTFQFKVIATSVTADTDSSFTVDATEVKNPSKFGAVRNYEDVVLAWNTIDCPIQVVNEKAKTVKNMYGDGENSVAPVLHTFLDLDGDTFLTLADAKALYALIIDTDAEYSVLADADADGFITIADLNALYQIFTGAKTIDEILNPEEDKVLGPREMRYENGALVYDSYCDFDFSGKIDQTSEMACMSGREDYKLFWAELGYTIP